MSKFFYVMGKALSNELSCTRTGLVIHGVTKSLQQIKSSEVDRAHDKLFICLTDVRHRYIEDLTRVVISYEMNMCVRFCLSYDPLKRDFITFKMNIISM